MHRLVDFAVLRTDILDLFSWLSVNLHGYIIFAAVTTLGRQLPGFHREMMIVKCKLFRNGFRDNPESSKITKFNKKLHESFCHQQMDFCRNENLIHWLFFG